MFSVTPGFFLFVFYEVVWWVSLNKGIRDVCVCVQDFHSHQVFTSKGGHIGGGVGEEISCHTMVIPFPEGEGETGFLQLQMFYFL